MRSATRPAAQWNLILAHLQHFKKPSKGYAWNALTSCVSTSVFSNLFRLAAHNRKKIAASSGEPYSYLLFKIHWHIENVLLIIYWKISFLAALLSTVNGTPFGNHWSSWLRNSKTKRNICAVLNFLKGNTVCKTHSWTDPRLNHCRDGTGR